MSRIIWMALANCGESSCTVDNVLSFFLAVGDPCYILDFTITSPLPLHDLLLDHSQLILKFSVDGVEYEELSTSLEDVEEGIWRVNGDMKM